MSKLTYPESPSTQHSGTLDVDISIFSTDLGKYMIIGYLDPYGIGSTLERTSYQIRTSHVGMPFGPGLSLTVMTQ